MALSMRMNAISSIIASTCFLCLEDFVKKGMVLRNFASSMSEEGDKKSTLELFKQKYKNSKLAIREVKERGNGSYLEGMKKVYSDYSTDDNGQQTSKLQAVNHKHEDSKQMVRKIKQEGSGSYINGLKKMNHQYKEEKATKTAASNNEASDLQTAEANGITAVSKKLAETKQQIYKKIQATSDRYSKASQSKSQKMIKKHLFFGGLAICGSIFMPRAYFLLNFAYFAAYQIYYFSDVINAGKQYPFLEGIRFEPIWKTFMVGGVLIFGFGLVKVARSVS